MDGIYSLFYKLFVVLWFSVTLFLVVGTSILVDVVLLVKIFKYSKLYMDVLRVVFLLWGQVY